MLVLRRKAACCLLMSLVLGVRTGPCAATVIAAVTGGSRAQAVIWTSLAAEESPDETDRPDGDQPASASSEESAKKLSQDSMPQAIDPRPKNGAAGVVTGSKASPEANGGPKRQVSALQRMLDPIDGYFEKYLVKPLKATLFFEIPIGKKKGIPLVVAWLLFGALFFTIRMGFINIRAFWHAIRLTKGDFDDPDDEGEVSHFQALASALSATVGLGNIAGVAIAISKGGPGATVWMIIIGLFGMSTKFTECSLGQLYRKVMPDGTVSGGPMRYLRDGLAELNLKPLGVFLSVFFAVLCIGASFGGGNAFQVVQSMGALQSEPKFQFLAENPWIYGLVMAFLVGLVIVGGIKSIGAVAGRIVPFMCAAYVAAALFILLKNFQHIPDALAAMIQGVTDPNALYGGALGVAVVGIGRAVFSNEAGAGSAAIAHSAARTDEPISEGIVALLEPFIDTVVICTMTALVIVITGVYDRSGAHADLVIAEKGAALTAHAFSEGGFEWFKWILYLAVVLFAYSTMISWSYYGERCWTMLFGIRASVSYKAVFLVFTFLGAIVTPTNILQFSDFLILGMAFPNILGVLLLSGKVKRELDRYWAKYRAGELERRPAD